MQVEASDVKVIDVVEDPKRSRLVLYWNTQGHSLLFDRPQYQIKGRISVVEEDNSVVKNKVNWACCV